MGLARHIITMAPSACLFSSSLGQALCADAKDPMFIVTTFVQLLSLAVTAIVHHKELKEANFHKKVPAMAAAITVHALLCQGTGVLSKNQLPAWASSLFALCCMCISGHLMANPSTLVPKPSVETGHLDDSFWSLPCPTVLSTEYLTSRLVRDKIGSLSQFGSSVFGYAGQEDPKWPLPPSSDGTSISLHSNAAPEHQSARKAEKIRHDVDTAFGINIEHIPRP